MGLTSVTVNLGQLLLKKETPQRTGEVTALSPSLLLAGAILEESGSAGFSSLRSVWPRSGPSAMPATGNEGVLALGETGC